MGGSAVMLPALQFNYRDQRLFPRDLTAFQFRAGVTSASVSFQREGGFDRPGPYLGAKLSYDYGGAISIGLESPANTSTELSLDPQSQQVGVNVKVAPTPFVRFDVAVATPKPGDNSIPSLSAGIEFGAGTLLPQLLDIEGKITKAGRTSARLLPETPDAIRDPRAFVKARSSTFGDIGTGVSAIRSLERADVTRPDVRARLGVTYGPDRVAPPNEPVMVRPELRIDLRLELRF